MTNPKPKPKKSLRLIVAAKKQSEFLAVIPRTWKVPLKECKIFKPITKRGDCNRLIAFDRQFKLLYRRPRCRNEIGSNGFPVKARLEVFIEKGDGIFSCVVSNIFKIGFCTITLRFFGCGVSCGFRVVLFWFPVFGLLFGVFPVSLWKMCASTAYLPSLILLPVSIMNEMYFDRVLFHYFR